MRVSRRSLFGGGAAAAIGAGVGAAIATTAHDEPSVATLPVNGEPVVATGTTQAGVDRPVIAQPHCLVTVVDLTEQPDLAALGERVVTLTSGQAGDVLPDGAGDLTVTVGTGTALPGFASDPDDLIRDGDLLLLVAATDASVLEPVTRDLVGQLTGATLRWQQRGQRGIRADGISRNPLGHLDGIIVPRGEDELAENVWRSDGSTVCVIRRLRLDLDRFLAETPERQDAVIGRRRADGAPLSGGDTMSEIDLDAKSADGNYLVPARSHARAAHPSFTGSKLMLRRGYPYDNGPGDQGLVFICHQADLDTFVRTQQRLDEADDLMDYVTATASGAFEILPGFTTDSPLGS
ncbi:Dyp-type peroxidase [Nocardioides sp.]|uniref:Dyp-type peroxidase n=1 Tax=Nocardioides sp. TaxID=35761 RepID=UPI0039E64DA6